jgi:hypothetical protein
VLYREPKLLKVVCGLLPSCEMRLALGDQAIVFGIKGVSVLYREPKLLKVFFVVNNDNFCCRV